MATSRTDERSATHARKPPRAGWISWCLWGVGLGAVLGSSLVSAAIGAPFHWADASQAVGFLAIGTTGFAIARRQPGNAVGWLYLGIWAGVGVVFGIGETATYWTTVVHPGSMGGDLSLWLNNWLWVPLFSVLLTYPFLLFPDGHLPSRRWRPLPWAIGVVIALWSLSFALENAQFSNYAGRHIDNPFAIATLTPIAEAGTGLFAVALIITMALCVTSLVVRFRRSHGDERQQLKWVMLAASVFVVWIALPFEHGNGGAIDVVQGFVLALIPISVGIAILKYRLYDIDVVIKKTVVFTLVTVVLLVLYLGVLALSTAGIASRQLLGLVLLAVTFNPIRRAARSIADRVAYGRRATGYEVLADFSGRMSEAYATDDVLPRMAQVLAGATGASTSTVWLKVGNELRPAATVGHETQRVPVSTTGDVVPPLPDDLVVDVRHQGDLLGALSVTMPLNDPLDPGREKLVRDLASQAGLVLRNVGLIEDLKASRQRLVAAQDDERRKLERNIHDGAQQQLVALAVKVRLAQQLTARDPDAAAAMLESVQTDTNDALQNLRDLARGIYPPLLADQGLVAALEAQARKAAVPTTIHGGGIGRFDQDIEAAVYFSCLEALQNTAKYAQATQATIALTNGDGSLTFTVTDDGIGFDESRTSFGTGLQGIADRLAALDGWMTLEARPGRGTVVTGRLPTKVAS